MSFLLAISFVASSSAQVPILVARFDPESQDQLHIASQIPELLASGLDDLAQYRVFTPQMAPAVGEQNAAHYLAQCQPQHVTQCTLKVANAAGARFALTGKINTVSQTDKENGGTPSDRSGDEFDFLDYDDSDWDIQASPDRRDAVQMDFNVELRVLDVPAAKEVSSFQQPLALNAIDDFTDAVSFVLMGIIDDDPLASQQVRTALGGDAVKSEAFEDLDTAYSYSPKNRPHLTMEELLADERGQMQPWIEMGMTVQQYLRWWNSKNDIQEWNKLTRGRRGHVMFRPTVGFGQGPWNTLYDGYYVLYPDTLLLLESHAYQVNSVSWGGIFGLDIGYGLTSFLELEAGASRGGGTFSVNFTQEIFGSDSPSMENTDFVTGTLQLHSGLRLVPFPTSVLRPVLGGAFVYWRGSSVTSHTDIPQDYLPEFPAPTMIGVQALAGTELRVHGSVDLFLQVPFQYLLSDMSAQVSPESADYPADSEPPAEAGRLFIQLLAGAQIRL